MSTAAKPNPAHRRLAELNEDLAIEADYLMRKYEAIKGQRGPYGRPTPEVIAAELRLATFVKTHGPIASEDWHYDYSRSWDSVVCSPYRKVPGKPKPYLRVFKSHIDPDNGRLPGQRG